MVDFLNIIRGHIDTDAGLTDVIPVQGMASAPHLDFAGGIRAQVDIPIFHAAKIQDVTTARFAIASASSHGRHDPRAHGRPAHRAQDHAGREDTIRPASVATSAWTAPYQPAARPTASTTRPPGAS